MTEWISVKDKLPVNHQIVLVTNGKGILVAWSEITNYDYIFMSTDTFHQFIGVTHWMPIPPLPDSKGNSN